jgi:hypothetical protein
MRINIAIELHTVYAYAGRDTCLCRKQSIRFITLVEQLPEIDRTGLGARDAGGRVGVIDHDRPNSKIVSE